GALGEGEAGGAGADGKVVGGGGTAAGELEGGDLRVPVEGAVIGNVLGRVPESAVVAGIDHQIGIVAPAGQIGGLRAATGQDGGFALRHGPRAVAGVAAGDGDGRVRAGG